MPLDGFYTFRLNLSAPSNASSATSPWFLHCLLIDAPHLLPAFVEQQKLTVLVKLDRDT